MLTYRDGPKVMSEYYCLFPYFLNQARAGFWPARNWFLEIGFVRDVCMHVCVCVHPEAINN